MTEGEAGMTEGEAGMTGRVAGMTGGSCVNGGWGRVGW